MDRGAWQVRVCGGHKESDTTERHFLSLSFSLITRLGGLLSGMVGELRFRTFIKTNTKLKRLVQKLKIEM